MRRHALGILSVLLLLAASYGLAVHGIRDSQNSMLASMCMRIGLVFGALWLAYPQLLKLEGKTSTGFLLLLTAVGLIVAVRPRSIVVLGPVMLILAVLQFFGWLMKPLPGKPRSSGSRTGVKPRQTRDN